MCPSIGTSPDFNLPSPEAPIQERYYHTKDGETFHHGLAGSLWSKAINSLSPELLSQIETGHSTLGRYTLRDKICGLGPNYINSG